MSRQILRRIPFLLLLSGLLVQPIASVFGRPSVSYPDKREAFILRADALFDQVDSKFEASLSEIKDPFNQSLEPESFHEESVGSDPAVVVLSDKDALRYVISIFKPRGTLLMGNKRIIVLDNGKRLSEGDSFQIIYQEKPFIVYIENITMRSCALKIGAEIEEKVFGSTSNKGIQRN
jgi:hypothetical protein